MNTPTLPDWIRPILSRVIGALVAGICAGIAKRYAFDVTPEQQQHITDWGVTGLTTLGFAVYSLTHRTGSVKTNPLDAASPVISGTATGPLGAGERTTLATKMEAAATSETAPVPVDAAAQPRATFAQKEEQRRASWASRPPEMRPEAETVTTGTGETVAVKAPRKRAPRKKDPADVIRIEKPPTTEADGLGFAPPRDNPHSERGEDD